MTIDNPSSVPVQPSPYNSTGTQSAQPLGGIDHLVPGIGSAGPYPVMDYSNPLPPTRYTSSMGYDNPSHLATGPAIAPGPPLEQYVPATPVRVLPHQHPLSSRRYSLSCLTSYCRRCPTAPPVTFLLTI
ncbi:hypothetical protein BJV77DRAFT_191168 [Russula vinacea]|nr:hypothetical protein BJV77DRAFT_191168 [Russula vinacea]